MKDTWLWGTAGTVVVVLVLANVVLLLAVHGRGLREGVRGRRAARFRAEFEQTLAELRSGLPDEALLRRRLDALNELERPIAALMLIDRVRTAPEERARLLGVLREIGAVDVTSADLAVAAWPASERPRDPDARLPRCRRSRARAARAALRSQQPRP